jgi:hypothetical protein
LNGVKEMRCLSIKEYEGKTRKQTWHVLIGLQNAIIYSALICIFTSECHGTMVGKEKRLCPVCDKEIYVLEWGSFGSYIYDRESKYDLIYFPYDDARFVWMCAHCGYAQVWEYFTDLSRKEKAKLKDYLATSWEPISPKDISIKTPNDISVIEKRFNQAVLINKFLNRDDDFWAWFNRVLIYHYRRIEPSKAMDLARSEIELLENKKGKFDIPLKNRAYLLGEYNRLIGNNDLALKHFYCALKVDSVSETKKINTILIVITFMLFLSLMLVYITNSFKKKTRIVFATVGMIIFVFCSFYLYRIPDVVRIQEGRNNYYNDIIYDRIKLLNSQSD